MLRFDLDLSHLSTSAARHYLTVIDVVGTATAAAPPITLAVASIFMHGLLTDYADHVPAVMYQRAVNAYIVTFALACAGAYAVTITATAITAALRTAVADRAV